MLSDMAHNRMSLFFHGQAPVGSVDRLDLALLVDLQRTIGVAGGQRFPDRL